MPQRFLRPGIRTSPRWNSVSHEAHTLYIAILTLVDDYGRYDGRPSVLWAEAFAVWNDQNPLKVVSPQDTVVFCQELAVSKLIQFYEVGGRKYLQVTQWEERARYKSHWPEPPMEESCLNPAESCLNPASLVPRPSPSPSPSEDTPTTFEKAMERVPIQLRSEVKPDFARMVFDTWDGRDGKDASGILVKFEKHLRKRWNAEGEQWQNGCHSRQKQVVKPEKSVEEQIKDSLNS
jgi:hypothetical protein